VLALAMAGAAAGFINVVAGGGSLLTMPLMIFLGLSPNAANGSARVAILVQNLAAVLRYRRAGKLELSLIKRLLPPLLVGASAGAWAATVIDPAGFRALLGWIMLGCAALVVFDPSRLMGREAASTRRPASAARLWPTLLVIGFYGGMIQAGVGYLILSGLTLVLGLELLEANVMKVVLVFAYTPIALLFFLSEGLVDATAAISLAAGQALGGWLGASAALKRGAGLIRAMLAMVIVVSGIKLLWF